MQEATLCWAMQGATASWENVEGNAFCFARFCTTNNFEEALGSCTAPVAMHRGSPFRAWYVWGASMVSSTCSPGAGGTGNEQAFLTTSEHMASRVEGSKRRENLDSEICEGLRQQVSDVDHAVLLMHLANEARTGPIDLTPTC